LRATKFLELSAAILEAASSPQRASRRFLVSAVDSALHLSSGEQWVRGPSPESGSWYICLNSVKGVNSEIVEGSDIRARPTNFYTLTATQLQDCGDKLCLDTRLWSKFST
jgi:hypothetical protein